MTTVVNKKGFTLIELLVVIAIISLLSSIVLSSLNTARGKARDAARTASILQVKTALQLYYIDNNGTYPTSADVVLDTALNAFLVSTYIRQLPVDPIAGQSYRYYNASAPNAVWYVIRIMYEIKTPCYISVGSVPSTGYWGLSVCQ